TVAGAALAAIAAWLWVRAGKRGSHAVAALGGASAGAGVLAAGWWAALPPAAVVAADLLLSFLPAPKDDAKEDPKAPDRRPESPARAGRSGGTDRWSGAFARAGLFAAGAAVVGTPALAFGPSAAWEASGLVAEGVWLLAGLAAAGLAAALAGRRWMAPAARRVVLGLTGAAAVSAAAVWTAGLEVRGSDMGALSALIAATVAAAVGLEGACRPAVSARGVAALAILPVLVLLGGWVWTDDPARTGLRAALTFVAALGLWGLWEVAAFRWPRNVRERRLLIMAVVLLALTGLRWSVRGTSASAGRGTLQLVAALAERPEPEVFVLAEPADQQAAKFLFSAADPTRRVFTYDPNQPRAVDSLNTALAKPEPPLVAVVGGGPAARLNALRPAGAAPPSPVGVLRGGDGTKKQVSLLVLPANRRGRPR
ncbi:hypothetical protein ACG2DA_17415, partial [Alienimonas sp. DA493]